MMLKQFLKGILNIVLLRGGPQDLPYSPLTLILLVGVSILITFLVSIKHVSLLLINLAFVFCMVWLLLFFTKKQDRFVQTMTALISCSWITSLLFFFFWYGTLLMTGITGHLRGVSSSNLSSILSLQLHKDTLPLTVIGIMMVGIFALLIWKFLVDISIIRQAAEWRLLRTIAFILLLNMLPAMVQQKLIQPDQKKTVPVVKSLQTQSVAPTTIIPLNK